MDNLLGEDYAENLSAAALTTEMWKSSARQQLTVLPTGYPMSGARGATIQGSVDGLLERLDRSLSGLEVEAEHNPHFSTFGLDLTTKNKCHLSLLIWYTDISHASLYMEIDMVKNTFKSGAVDHGRFPIDVVNQILLEVAVKEEGFLPPFEPLGPVTEGATSQKASKNAREIPMREKVDLSKRVDLSGGDCLLGRGGVTNHHQGNGTYRDIARKYVKKYGKASSRAEKNVVLGRVLKMLKAKKIRFVGEVDGCYYEANKAVVEGKVKEFLRTGGMKAPAKK